MIGLPVVEGTNPASCFPRAVIGSEATCYSRIWSEVWWICTVLIRADCSFHDFNLRIRLFSQAFAADIYASKFGDGHPNLYTGMQFRDKVNNNEKRICLFLNSVVCDCECNNSFLLRCWPREEAKKPWNFSPIFLEGNHHHKLSSIAGQNIVCDICT